jgi:hypothetical protein
MERLLNTSAEITTECHGDGRRILYAETGGGEYLDDGGQDIGRGGVTELVDLLGKPLTRTNNTWPHHFMKVQ